VLFGVGGDGRFVTGDGDGIIFVDDSSPGGGVAVGDENGAISGLGSFGANVGVSVVVGPIVGGSKYSHLGRTSTTPSLVSRLA
jgi:hypothetical protein